MLRKLFHRFVPASLYGGETAFPTLSMIDRELRHCSQPAAAASVVEESKQDLYVRLRRRFPSTVAKALALKILNICLAKYHYSARSTSVLSRPIGLVVDPSNVCQLACPGCVHSAGSEARELFDWPNGTLSEERLSALLKLYGPYAIGVLFCNYGEPLLNLNTPKFISQAKRYLMRTALSTSLSVQKFDPDAYVESGLDFMVISIDGATQPVYERFRRHGNLELVLGNVRKLVATKRKLGSSTPLLAWRFLAFEHNAHEIPLAKHLARKLGVNQFQVSNPFDVTWDDTEMRPAAVRPSHRRLDWHSIANFGADGNLISDKAAAANIACAFESPWNEHATSNAARTSGHTCHWLYKNIVMDATGRILPCCGAPRPDANLVFGTIEGNGADLFDTEMYRQARSFFTGTRASDNSPYCTQCEWDQTAVNIGGTEIRRYFRTVDAAFFDRQSLQLLSGW